MSKLEKIAEWFDRRLQLGGVIRETMAHPVPRKSASWWYVFGSAALTLFILQVFTGILLALTWIIHVFGDRKGLLMVQSRCLRGFDTNRRPFRERAYHNTACSLPGNF